jgi:predicted phosphodiesterase
MKLLILSDIHGNWPALESVLEAEGSWDAVAFCGDVVDYGPHPTQCLRWVAERLEEDFVLPGHTHVQGTRSLGKLTVVNPGSVGLARDGGGQACYAVLDGSEMMLKQVHYDVAHTVRDLRSAPLPQYLIDGLTEVLSPQRLADAGEVPSD